MTGTGLADGVMTVPCKSTGWWIRIGQTVRCHDRPRSTIACQPAVNH